MEKRGKQGEISKKSRPAEAFGLAQPNAVALALEGGGMGVVRDDFTQLGLGQIGLVFGEVKLGQLDAGAGIVVAGQDLLPNGDGGVGFIEGGQALGIGHEGVAVVVFWIFAANLFEKGAGGGGVLLAQEALPMWARASMSAGSRSSEAR